jgi:hypothetical protein
VVHPKDYIKYKYFSLKRNIYLGKLSVNEGFAIAFTAMTASLGHLYYMVVKNVDKSDRPIREDFIRYLNLSLIEQRGIIKAAFATSVNHKKIFEADRFAVNLKRLSVVDNIEVELGKHGDINQLVIDKIVLFAPWYWADLASKEISHVKKNITSSIEKLISIFKEEATLEDLDKVLQKSLLNEALKLSR